MTSPLEVSPTALVADPEAVLSGGGRIEGRSLGQIAWMRLKRDKVALGGGAVIVVLISIAIFAPLIVKWLGDPPNEFHQNLIDTAGLGAEIRSHRKLLDDFEARMKPAPKPA